MIRPYFSSTSKTSLIQKVIDLLDKAILLSIFHKIEIQIMCFSFTDELVYQKLKTIAVKHPNIQIQILADWGNISNNNDRKIPLLTQLESSNFQIRFKYDQPYQWDAEQQKLKWSYHTSLGLLHHRTILIIKDNNPHILQTGSFNWTRQASRNYENILEITAPTTKSKTFHILEAFKREFDTLWNNFDLSLSSIHSKEHLNHIKHQYAKNPDISPNHILPIHSAHKDYQKPLTPKKILVTEDTLVAFSSKHPYVDNRPYGFHIKNAYRYFMLKKNSDGEKRAPITITTLSLDCITRVKPNQILRIAFFALSHRVAEYGALLQAARRGVILKIILDKYVNTEILTKLKEVIKKEHLNIEVKFGKRSMHQKYMVDLTNGNVLTGTANMTTDAENRHAEHRFLFKNNHRLAERFVEDFETMWSRIKKPNLESEVL